MLQSSFQHADVRRPQPQDEIKPQGPKLVKPLEAKVKHQPLRHSLKRCDPPHLHSFPAFTIDQRLRFRALSVVLRSSCASWHIHAQLIKHTWRVFRFDSVLSKGPSKWSDDLGHDFRPSYSSKKATQGPARAPNCFRTGDLHITTKMPGLQTP